jgi:glycosyltransferase involved in cell wall biosynthesis
MQEQVPQSDIKSARKLRVLIELRPALDGHAGIPQETRLLFCALRQIDGITVTGMIQHSGHTLAKGLPANGRNIARDKAIYQLSRVVISLKQGLRYTWLATIGMAIRQLFGDTEELSRFESLHFKDYLWRALFSNTLHTDDFDLVTSADFRILQVPWTGMHRYGLINRMLGLWRYPRIDTSEFDIFIAETPFPGRISKNTRMIVRYHDAIPIFMPHTIADKKYHQASHFNALKQNVMDGAYFSCVSEATRQDLLSIFPDVADRASTIHNMVSRQYFDEDSSPKRIPEIFRTRLNGSVGIGTGIHAISEISNEKIEYLLAVSTIEPRKNHLTLLAGWEQLRSKGHSNLKLVLVGMLGWENASIVKQFRPWMEAGELFLLTDVQSHELRMLYKHALLTVCPSFSEGFDFSGVEAVRCGGTVVASDIPVHREIFGDAASYFNTYSSLDLAQKMQAVIASERQKTTVQSHFPYDTASLSQSWLKMLLR